MNVDRVWARGDREQLAATTPHDCVLDRRTVNGYGRELCECWFESTKSVSFVEAGNEQ